MIKFLTVAFITFTTSLSFATDIDTQRTKKGYQLLLTISQQLPLPSYLDSVRDIPEHQKLVVSTKQFNGLLVDLSQELTKIAYLPELNMRLKKFMVGNGLTQAMIASHHLKAAENSFVNILILFELQKLMNERMDLQFFGRETLENLTTSIADSVRLHYKIAETHLSRTIIGRPAAERMKKNFIDLGLQFEITLSPSEQWINEYLGRPKNYVSQLSPNDVIERVLDTEGRMTMRKLRGPRLSECIAFFM